MNSHQNAALTNDLLNLILLSSQTFLASTMILNLHEGISMSNPYCNNSGFKNPMSSKWVLMALIKFAIYFINELKKNF